MAIENKTIHYNIAQQMNTQKPAGHRQDKGRHSAEQAYHNPAAPSVQVRHDEKNVIPAKAGIRRTKEIDSRLHGNVGLGWGSDENTINIIKDSLKNALISIEKYMNRDIRFEVENGIEPKAIVVKIIDKESGETVRQIPLEDALELSRHLNAKLEETVKNQSGLFIDKEI